MKSIRASDSYSISLTQHIRINQSRANIYDSKSKFLSINDALFSKYEYVIATDRVVIL